MSEMNEELANKLDSRGVTMLEFAIIAPLFFLLLFGAVNFAFILSQFSLISDTMRASGRDAVKMSPPSTCIEVLDEAERLFVEKWETVDRSSETLTALACCLDASTGMRFVAIQVKSEVPCPQCPMILRKINGFVTFNETYSFPVESNEVCAADCNGSCYGDCFAGSDPCGTAGF